MELFPTVLSTSSQPDGSSQQSTATGHGPPHTVSRLSSECSTAVAHTWPLLDAWSTGLKDRNSELACVSHFFCIGVLRPVTSIMCRHSWASLPQAGTGRQAPPLAWVLPGCSHS